MSIRTHTELAATLARVIVECAEDPEHTSLIIEPNLPSLCDLASVEIERLADSVHVSTRTSEGKMADFYLSLSYRHDVFACERAAWEIVGRKMP